MADIDISKIKIIAMYFEKENYEKQFFLGNAHIRLLDFNMNIRGVYFKKKKNFWCISMPTIFYINTEIGKKQKCPVFTLDDPNNNKKFQRKIKELIQKEIELKIMQQKK